jgi:hypothetical protein
MKRFKIIYGLFLYISLFVSCTSNEIQNHAYNGKYCPNEISLFSIQDSLKKISVDYKIEPDLLIESIEDKIGQDLCQNMVTFGLALRDSEPIKVHLLKECGDRDMGFHRKYPEVKILLNQKGLLMIENELTPIDSVKLWIHKNFPNDEMSDLEEISIKWTSETPKDSIELAFNNIINGYLLNYAELSRKLFSKDICDLTENQVDSLKVKLPFKVRLGFGRHFTLPLPRSPELIE